MKKIVLAAFAAAVAVPVAAAPGDTDTTQGEATAEIVAPISIEHDVDSVLNFGIIIATDTAGTVNVTTGGIASIGSGDILLASDTTSSADSFTVSGDPDRAFTIELSGGTVTSGGNSMPFTTTTDDTTVALNGSGSFQFAVGGTLSVAANQAAGTYTGQYDVTVSYD